MKNIIIRNDLRNNAVVFDADTETPEGTIKVWDGKKNGAMEEVSLEYYRSTNPIKDEAKVMELVKSYLTNFKISETDVVVRQRLVKASVKNAVKSDGGNNTSTTQQEARMVDVNVLKQNLMNAFAKALETI